MSGERDSVSGRASRLKAYTGAFSAGLVVGVALGVLGAIVWDALGDMERSTHLSDLKILKEHLIRRAVREGRYPSDLASLIKELGYGEDLNAEDFVYSAAGETYDIHESDLIVFNERRPHRYGFVVGRFEMRQGYHNFRIGHRTSDGTLVP